MATLRRRILRRLFNALARYQYYEHRLRDYVQWLLYHHSPRPSSPLQVMLDGVDITSAFLRGCAWEVATSTIRLDGLLHFYSGYFREDLRVLQISNDGITYRVDLERGQVLRADPQKKEAMGELLFCSLKIDDPCIYNLLSHV